jgi:phosphoribosylaminoimidazole (AIR) synthetase
MGIGFVVVMPASRVAAVLGGLWRTGVPAFRIGEIRAGARGIEYR